MADTAAELLASERTLTTEAIAETVVERRQTRARNPIAAVRAALDQDARLHRLDDGRWTMPLHLLDGAVFTHELTEREAQVGALPVDPDLSPLWYLVMKGLSMADGGALRLRGSDEAPALLGPAVRRAIMGPDGWLPRSPGAFLHLRLSGGRLSVAEGPRSDAAARLTERRLVTSAKECLNRDVPRYDDPGATQIDHVVIQAAANVPGLLDQPLSPLGTLLRAAGLEVHGMEVGLPGTDWAVRSWSRIWDVGAPDEDQDDALDLEDEVAELAETFDLTDLEIRELRLLLVSMELEPGEAPIEDPSTLGAMAHFLESTPLAEIIGRKAWHQQSVGSLAERILSATPPTRGSGVLYVLALVAEAQERPDLAEERLHASLRDDPAFGPSLIALARIEEDRGRYPDALALLRRAAIPLDDPLRAFLEAALRPEGGKIGRNDPCPCGSGRKVKVCHPGGSVRLSPGSRLIRKTRTFAEQPDNDGRIHLLMEACGAGVEHDPILDDTDTEADSWELQHALATDLMLFEHGGLDRFLRVRGSLLPADEVELAETWRSSRRSLYEVRAVAPGVGVTLRDLIDDSLVEVPDRSVSRQAGTLDLLSARILPDGAGKLLIGDVFLVPRGQRQHVQDLVMGGDGLELLAWLADPHPRFRLRTADGHEMVFVTSVWRVPDPERVRRSLLVALHNDGDDRFTWLVPRDGNDSIAGSITLRGREATVETRSRERASGLEAIMRASAPGMRLIRREEVDAEEAVRQRRRVGPVDPPASPELDPATNPELAAILDEYIQSHEHRWVDESIPALGSMTPRQALVDPVMRPELDALLDDMDWQLRRSDGTGMMDSRRIRRLLGIAPGTGQA